MSNPEDLLDTREAAVYLGGERRPFNENTLRIWRVQGRGPVYRRLMGRIRYLRSDLDQFIEDATRTKTNGSRSKSPADTQPAADAQRADRSAVAA